MECFLSLLWTTANMEKWWVHWRTRLLFRRTRWRDGLTATSWILSRVNVKSCTLGGITPCTSTGWVPTDWEAALQRRIWLSWWTVRLPQASNVSLFKDGQQHHSCIMKSVTSRLSEVILVRPCLECCVPVWVPQYKRDMDIVEEAQ